MTKPSLYILGLSVAVALVTGCGRGFEAVKSKEQIKVVKSQEGATENGGIGAEGISGETAGAPNAEALQAEVERKNNENVQKDPQTDKIELVDDDGDAERTFKAVTAIKKDSKLIVSAIMQSKDTEPVLIVDITAPLTVQVTDDQGQTEEKQIKDGEFQYSTVGMVDVKALSGRIENAEEIKKQFLMVYACANNCEEVQVVRLQRIVERAVVDGKTVLAGNAASFIFEFSQDSTEGVLKTAMPFTGNTLQSIPQFIESMSDAQLDAMAKDQHKGPLRRRN